MPDATVLLAGTVAVILGGVLHSAAGFGFALVAVPIVAAVAPEAVPSTLLLLSLPVNLFMLTGERAVDRGGAARMTIGKVLGTAIGAWVLVSIPQGDLQLVFGASLVMAAAAVVLHPTVGITPTRELVVGTVAGIMGSTTAVGGPLLAVLYSSRDGRILRSTLAVVFLAGLFLALTAQAAIGRLGWWHLSYAVALVPGMALGLYLGYRMRPVLDAGWLRVLVLLTAICGGIFTIAAAVAK